MMNCPKCSSEPLVETPSLGNIPLDVCPGCSGIWFDKGELEALLKQSQGWQAANFDLLNPKPANLDCPRCKTKMSRGGLVNPLLLVDKCDACGGVWLDSRELDLVKKQLGLTGGATTVSVEKPAEAPVEPVKVSRFNLITIVSLIAIVLGLAGVSYEMYLYFSPAASVAHAPSRVMAIGSLILAAAGVFGLNKD